jgi:type VI secretion system protein VasI
MNFKIMSVALIFASTSALAEPDRGLAGCAIIENSVNRLACFDELAKKRDVASPAIVSEKKGDWNVETETSKIDDTKNVFLSLTSENEFEGKYRDMKRATLYIACRERSTNVFFLFGDHFMADSGGFDEVTVRIGKQKARSIRMTASTDHGALGVWSGSGVTLVKSMFGNERLLVRATPLSERAITAEFNIGGLESAIKPLRSACDW